MSRLAREISRFTKKEVNAFWENARCVVKDVGLRIFIAPRQKTFGRILVVTSRKVGNAPERNKIRRQLKAIFYKNKWFNQEYDCVVIVKKEGIKLPFAKLETLLSKAIEQKKPTS